MKSNANKPDPHALGIARAVQKRVAPDWVILFGSRAAGDYREDSDVDILVVTQDKETRGNRPGAGAGDAAWEYMESHPLLLPVSIVSMTRSEFDRNRRAKQHLAGQADHHGLLISGDGHDLNSLCDYLERLQDWSQPGLEELHESLTSLFDHTRYDYPEHRSGRGNWLADYADVYRYDVNPRPMTQEEKQELRQLVKNAIELLTERIHRVSGTGDSDIFTEGKRPWE